jgi:GAF domain-containing protein
VQLLDGARFKGFTMEDKGFSARMLTFARDLRTADSLLGTADHVTVESLQLVDGCDHASLSMTRRKERFKTLAASDDMARSMDALQIETAQGPCLDAMWDQELVVSRDLSGEPRWPAFAAAAVQRHGIRSVMCIRMFTNEKTVGALNMFSHHVGGFDEADRDEVVAIAAHAAIAMAAAEKVESLRSAIDTRTVIGQATGILMQQFDIDPSAAFALLVRASSQQNRKLREVALDVVTRTGPGIGARGRY